MKRFFLFAVVALLSVIVLSTADARRRPKEEKSTPIPLSIDPAGGTSPQETARLLAGMPLNPRSPLAPLTQTAAWQDHSAQFEAAFARVVRGKFARLHHWQDTYLPESKEPVPVAYYMFSGPDYLYLDQFFPNASVYVMCGKEPLGPAPDPLKMDIGYFGAALQNLQNAMKSSLTATYFITEDMKVDLQQQQLTGTVPILYVFLARAGKSIREVAYISLDQNGNLRENVSGGTKGVRISFVDEASGRKQTLYYFSTDISNGGIGANPGFIKFCDRQGTGVSFLKSSSYLMFEDGFSRVRDFLLSHSQMIVQDDSGIPIRFFDNDKWSLRFFGTYAGPIELFKQHYQPKLTELFQQSNPPEFGIGFGYQWNYHKSNLIVAKRL